MPARFVSAASPRPSPRPLMPARCASAASPPPWPRPPMPPRCASVASPPPSPRPLIAGKVRLGGFAPALAPTADAGKVRLGGFAPTLAPTADAGKVRLGGFAPDHRPDRRRRQGAPRRLRPDAAGALTTAFRHPRQARPTPLGSGPAFARSMAPDQDEILVDIATARSRLSTADKKTPAGLVPSLYSDGPPPAARRPLGGRLAADTGVPLLRAVHQRVRLRLLRLPSDQLQSAVGRPRRDVDLGGRRDLAATEVRAISQLPRPVRLRSPPRRSANTRRHSSGPCRNLA